MVGWVSPRGSVSSQTHASPPSYWLLGRRTLRSYGIGQAAAVMACQIAGAIAGAALADAMFAEPVLSPSHHHRGGAPILLSEVVATAGLLFVIVALARTGRLEHVAWAVGAWIGAAGSKSKNPPSSRAERQGGCGG